MVQSPTWGWVDARTIAFLVASAAALGWMLVRCTRHPAPIIDLTLFESRNLTLFNVMAFAVSSDVVTLWLLATGASFTGVTVMSTVARALFVVPSFTRKVKLSVPL